MKIRYVQPTNCFLCLLGALLCGLANAQDTPTVTAVTEKEDVFVGEPFVLQIQVNNVNDVDTPDLTSLSEDFTVEYGGGNRNNSESISIVNGRTTRMVSRQYIINYRLTAKRPGRLEIPPVTVNVSGQALTTQALVVQARPPEPVKNFKLVTTLSKKTSYVGEPVSMTTTYYIAENTGSISELVYTLPVLNSPDFSAEPFEMQDQPGKDYLRIPVNGEDVKVEKGNARLNGERFVTLTFQHVLVAKTPGDLSIPAATAAAEAVFGQRQSASPFGGMSLFGSRNQYKTVVVQADPLTLSVRPVPEEGKPANFSGLIGAFTISATASPTTVNVGDPITLTITVDGSYHLSHFELPPLQQQAALVEHFRIPEEMAPGRTDESRKIFTQTIRAESSSVKEIPPIELAYFDTSTGHYESASTNPIPLTVNETQVVTASDAEGYQQSVKSIEHVAVNGGIAHNYTESDALASQHFGPDVWMRGASSWLLLLLPPLAWGAMAGAVLLRRFQGFHPKGRARKQARAVLATTLTELPEGTDVHGKALQALRSYLGAKLSANASALTFGDVEPGLRKQGASQASLDALKIVFDECEAHHYSGASGTPSSDIVARVLACADALEKEIG